MSGETRQTFIRRSLSQQLRKHRSALACVPHVHGAGNRRHAMPKGNSATGSTAPHASVRSNAMPVATCWRFIYATSSSIGPASDRFSLDTSLRETTSVVWQNTHTVSCAFSNARYSEMGARKCLAMISARTGHSGSEFSSPASATSGMEASSPNKLAA